MKTLITLSILCASCGGPSRTTAARYPGSPLAFDPAQSDAKAVEIADKVFTTAGGPGHWDNVKQIKWTQITLKDNAPTREVEEAWDRWNGRHWGLLHQDETATIASHALYGDFSSAWSETKQGHHELFETAQRDEAVKHAREAFKLDTGLLCLPFLLHEPGAKLHYVGTVQADGKEYEQIDLSFAPADTSRTGYTFVAFVDPATNLIYRAEVLNVATNARAGYKLKDWVTSGGMQFATTRENLGDTSQTIKIKDVTIGEPDDQLYLPPVT